jgi:hypothetical protein
MQYSYKLRERSREKLIKGGIKKTKKRRKGG